MFALVLVFGFVTEVSVGLIGAMGLVVASWLTTQRSAAKNAKVSRTTSASIDEKIGVPNGRGNVVDMLNMIVDQVDHLQQGQSAISSDLTNVRERMAFLEGTVGIAQTPVRPPAPPPSPPPPPPA